MTTGPKLESALSTHQGIVREDNQDSIRASDLSGDAHLASHGHLFAVADGMGGYSYGGVASATAIEVVFDTFYAGNPSQPAQNLKKAVQQANVAVYQTSHRLNAGRMGTTLTAAALVGNKLHIGHVGDSRLYLVRDGKATCLTTDHTVVGELVRMRVLSPDKVRTHYQRSQLNRSIGVELFVQPEIQQVQVQDHDTLILCSDGVWSVIEDEEFGQLAGATSDMNVVSQRLIELAMERESDDNVSAMAVHIHRLAEKATQPEKSDAPRAWGVSRLFGRFSTAK